MCNDDINIGHRRWAKRIPHMGPPLKYEKVSHWLSLGLLRVSQVLPKTHINQLLSFWHPICRTLLTPSVVYISVNITHELLCILDDHCREHTEFIIADIRVVYPNSVQKCSVKGTASLKTRLIISFFSSLKKFCTFQNQKGLFHRA